MRSHTTIPFMWLGLFWGTCFMLATSSDLNALFLLEHGLTFETRFNKGWSVTVTITNNGRSDAVLEDVKKGSGFFEFREKVSKHSYRMVRGVARPFGVNIAGTITVPGKGGKVEVEFDLRDYRITPGAPAELRGFECRFWYSFALGESKSSSRQEICEGQFSGDWVDCPVLEVGPNMRLPLPLGIPSATK